MKIILIHMEDIVNYAVCHWLIVINAMVKQPALNAKITGIFIKINVIKIAIFLHLIFMLIMEHVPYFLFLMLY